MSIHPAEVPIIAATRERILSLPGSAASREHVTCRTVAHAADAYQFALDEYEAAPSPEREAAMENARIHLRDAVMEMRLAR